MISRYEVKEISAIWSLKAKYNYFLKVELAILGALEDAQIAPAGSVKEIKENAIINLDRIDQLDQITRHDVIAFCSSITEQVPPAFAKFFHYGVTSSDIIDTSLSLQLKDTLDVTISDITLLLKSLKTVAITHQNDICMGHSHGIYAEPMGLGQKFLSFYNELYRCLEKLKHYQYSELTCQFSGTVGNYTVLNHALEQKAAEIIGLKVEQVSTQVIPKDHLTTIIHTTIQAALTLERLATDLRHFQRSEVGLIYEGFSPGQKGSSTMPHKKNPISSENITGLCRILKSHARIVQDNNILWHERDISHSSNERMYLPDHFGILSYILRRMTRIIDHLVIDTNKMEKIVLENDYYLSSYLMHQLLLKTELSREKTYQIIQELSFESQRTKEKLTNLFNKKMKSLNIDYCVSDMNLDQLKKIFLKETRYVFDRSFKSYQLEE